MIVTALVEIGLVGNLVTRQADALGPTIRFDPIGS
jgi:hypothetical protein